jgi:amidase
MARSIADLALLLSVQAGYDARAPLSWDGDGSRFRAPLERDFKGTRIAWTGDFQGYLPFEPGVLKVCRAALRTFETLGAIVEEAQPDYSIEAVWRAWLKLRAWQSGGGLLAYYNDPAKRALMKPEAIFEIESALKLGVFDITAASVVRTEWYQAVRQFFEEYDYWIIPTAQVFPFDATMHWPQEIAGKKMETYHEWMKGVLPVTMSGCPALAAPAGFNDEGLPMGIQIVGPNRAEFACLQLAQAYDAATGWVTRRPPPLLGG